MSERNLYVPVEENLGRDCENWNNKCTYPKFEMQGRTSCEGVIDPVCIYLREGRRVKDFDLIDAQVTELKTTIPGNPHSIPAGRPINLE